MQDFYLILDTLNSALKEGDFIKTVSFGDLTRIANYKRDVYALGHIMVNSVTIEKNVVRYSISLFAMDVVDQTKEFPIDKFRGNNCEQEILQETLSVLTRVAARMIRGDLFDALIQIDGSPTLEPFTDRFEDVVAGWAMDFDILIPNEMSIC